MARALLALTLLTVVATDARAEQRLSAGELAAKIDEHIAARWKDRNVTPAPLADDGELVRRLYLDLHGRIPDIVAARDFAENLAKDKREKQVARLLSEERYAAHWANVWRAWLLPEAGEPQSHSNARTFERWWRGNLQKNLPYDRAVAEMIGSLGQLNRGSAGAFLAARENKPEEVASAVSRLFLGVKLECAQCHNHPFAQWKKQQFWELAAFFAPLATSGQIKVDTPTMQKTVQARFLDGRLPKPDGDLRQDLADWMAAPDNPYFARAAVNRVWEQLLGTGLIEPIDEEGPDNPPSHPQLLDLLARQFIEHKFDLKYLIQAITLSDAYGRTSAQTHPSQADPRLFARARLRGLSAEQLYDSMMVAAGREDEVEAEVNYYDTQGELPPRQEFLRKFPSPTKRSEQETSILQALHLMNGKIVTEAVSLERNENLKALAGGVSKTKRVEQLYLVTLSRKPTAKESARLVKYLEARGTGGNESSALRDVFWALINSSEFYLNH